MDGPLSLTGTEKLLQGSVDRAREAADSAPREAGERMEALFATMLVKELRKSLPDEGLFGDGPGADTFNGWFDEHIGEQLAADGALDLAGRVKAALEAKQELAE